MKKVLIAAVFASFAISTVYADTVRMGTEGAYMPYNGIDDNGQFIGFEIDLGNELCKRANLDCAWVKNDWDSIIPNLKGGNYDTIIAGMSITEERMKEIDFTRPYTMPDPSTYVTLSGASVDLKSGVIAAQTGTIQASYIVDSGATLVEFATPDETIAAGRNGEADAVLADDAFLKPFVEESGGELSFAGDSVFIGGGVGMGIRKSDSSLKEKFNSAINSMCDDGSLNSLITEWEISETFPDCK